MMRTTSNFPRTELYPNRLKNDTASSLLTKYDIPVTHLDFSYVEKCGDRRELERILHVLKSGEEGYYPELTKATEERLRSVHPKSKFLRDTSRVLTREEIEGEEWNDIARNLNEWIADVSQESREPESRKGNGTFIATDVRKQETVVPTTSVSSKHQKIQSTDYAAWDRYDVDAEILEMDLKEERMREESKRRIPTRKIPKEVRFSAFATEAESRAEGKEEKEKGNEYFREGNYETAVSHYTASIRCFKTVEALNNRAMAYLKLSLYEEAIEDCDSAITLDPDNLKANWRKAVALERLGNFDRALECAERCIDVDPNDENIQSFAGNIRKKCGGTGLAKRRILVTENEREDSEDQLVPVPIPGTSRMPEPFYIPCKKNEMKVITRILYQKSRDQDNLSHILNNMNCSHNMNRCEQVERRKLETSN